MKSTLKYSKEQDNTLSIHTTTLLAASITGWKLQDKNSNMCSMPTSRAYILHNEKQGKNLLSQVVLLDILIRGQRAENASPPPC